MKNLRTESIIIATGLAVLGLFLYFGLSAFSNRERVVSVRGLAEKEIPADRVTWPVVYKTTGSNLTALYADINNANAKITDFLKQNGIPAKDITAAAPKIVDLLADRYAQPLNGRDRYNVTSIVTVASGEVEKVRALMPRMGELLKQGIAISAEDYENRVTYEFTGLNSIKPKMIEEATQNAREAAEKFASDSQSKLGKIKNATQGLFSIENRDIYTPHVKKVRVVTSVNFYLED